jgi:hypothetical protein
MFSAASLQRMRDEVAGIQGFDSLRQSYWRGQSVFTTPLLRYAVAGGWIGWSDLAIQPSDSGDFLRTNRFRMYSQENGDHFLTRTEAWSWRKKLRYDVLRIKSDGLTQLRLLKAVNCLDLVNRKKLIEQITAVQVLSATPPGQPPMPDWRQVRGLFFTPCHPALQDTYFSVAALEILGGLDWMDREECIKGILKRHEGKGFFTSPDSGGYNEYHIDGSARDTIAAFEALRILGALDRVKDLEQWKFRPLRHGVARNQLTWHDVEAWVCQQRLERILQLRREKPQSPIGSLLNND